MPRNDQVMRQWHLLRLLESSRGVTLDEIADRLPADYPRHGRTIRRDLEGLATIFPILNERSDGRVRSDLLEVRAAPIVRASAGPSGEERPRARRGQHSGTGPE